MSVIVLVWPWYWPEGSHNGFRLQAILAAQYQGHRTTNIVVFTPHVPVYFWPNRHNLGDIELKFCILP